MATYAHFVYVYVQVIHVHAYPLSVFVWNLYEYLALFSKNSRYTKWMIQILHITQKDVV